MWEVLEYSNVPAPRQRMVMLVEPRSGSADVPRMEKSLTGCR